MIGDGWLAAEREASAQRSLVTPASPDEMWAIVSRPDLALIEPGVALVLPVPDDPRPLTLVVRTRDGLTTAAVIESVPYGEQRGIASLAHPTGITTSYTVQPASIGSRLRMRLSAVRPRPQARELRDYFDFVLEDRLEAIRRIAAGTRELAQPRPADVLAAALSLDAPSATIPASRTFSHAAQAIWAIVVPRTGWVYGAGLAAGSWRCRVDDQFRGELSEVLEVEEPTRYASRSLAGAPHPTLSTWTLEPVAGGTKVTLEHRCATSHVGLAGSVEDSLDRLQALLER